MSKSGTGGLIATIIAGFASIVPLARSCSKVDDVARVGKHMSHIDDVHDANRVGRYAKNADRMGNVAAYSKSAGNYNKNPYALVEAIQDMQVQKRLEADQLAYLKKEKPDFAEKLNKIDKTEWSKTDRTRYRKAVDDLKAEYLTKEDLVQFAKQVKRAKTIMRVIKLYYPDNHDTSIDDLHFTIPQIIEIEKESSYDAHKIRIPADYTLVKSIQFKNVTHLWADTVSSITLYYLPNAVDYREWYLLRNERKTHTSYYNPRPALITFNSLKPFEYSVAVRSGLRFGLIKPLPKNPHYWVEIESKDLTFIQEKAPQIFADMVK